MDNLDNFDMGSFISKFKLINRWNESSLSLCLLNKIDIYQLYHKTFFYMDLLAQTKTKDLFLHVGDRRCTNMLRDYLFKWHGTEEDYNSIKRRCTGFYIDFKDLLDFTIEHFVMVKKYGLK